MVDLVAVVRVGNAHAVAAELGMRLSLCQRGAVLTRMDVVQLERGLLALARASRKRDVGKDYVLGGSPVRHHASPL